MSGVGYATNYATRGYFDVIKVLGEYFQYRASGLGW